VLVINDQYVVIPTPIEYLSFTAMIPSLNVTKTSVVEVGDAGDALAKIWAKLW